MTQILVFRVAGQEFGADVAAVREVLTVPEVTAIPHASPPVVGVFNLRGHIATAVDGAQALQLKRDTEEPYSRIVVASVDRHLVGILVDAATGVITIDEAAVKPTPGAAVGGDGRGLARGVVVVADRAIVLVDPGAILAKGAAIAAAGGAPRVQNRDEKQNESVV